MARKAMARSPMPEVCGNFHLQIPARLEQAIVWVTPGVVSRIDLTARPGTERAVHGPSASLVHLGTPNGPIIHTLHARDPRMGETVHEADGEEMREVIERLGPTPAGPEPILCLPGAGFRRPPRIGREGPQAVFGAVQQRSTATALAGVSRGRPREGPPAVASPHAC